MSFMLQNQTLMAEILFQRNGNIFLFILVKALGTLMGTNPEGLHWERRTGHFLPKTA